MVQLSLQHIDKIYDNKVQAVYDFNIDVKDGEFIVLVGPSGCGKSTTLRMIAGREDISEGDLYIDGELMNGLLHPAREVWKTYAAQVEGSFTKQELQTLKNGVPLEDGMTAPAKVRVLDWDDRTGRTKVEISIHEGKNRQVRRMCEAVGHPVRALKRTEFAGLNLSGVKRGEYRTLTAEEVAYLYEVAGLPIPGGQRKG